MNGNKLDDFWFSDDLARDDKALLREINKLPAIETWSGPSLVKFALKLAKYQSTFFGPSGIRTVPQMMWESKEAAWYEAASKYLHWFTAPSRGSLFWSLGALDARINVPFISELYAGMQADLMDSSPGGDVSVLSYAAATNTLPPPSYLGAYRAVLEDKIEKYDTKFIGATLSSLAKLALHESDFLTEDMLHKIQQAIGKRQNNDAAAIVYWSLAVMSVLKPLSKAALEASEALVDCIKPGALSGKASTAAYCAAKRLCAHKADRFVFDRARPVRTSYCEDYFRRKMAENGFSLADAHSNKPLLDNIDCVVKTSGRNVFVEHDGRYHFLSRLQGELVGYNGSTQFMTALISSEAPDNVLVRVPYYLIDKMERRHFESMHEQLSTVRPGAYVLKCHKDGARLERFFYAPTPALG